MATKTCESNQQDRRYPLDRVVRIVGGRGGHKSLGIFARRPVGQHQRHTRRLAWGGLDSETAFELEVGLTDLALCSASQYAGTRTLNGYHV